MPKRDTHIVTLLRHSGHDPDAALELLAIAAEHLKARQPLPDALADYLAHAFRMAVATPEPISGKPIERERIARLAFALGMTRNEGRPRREVPKGDVALAVAMFGEAVSETELKHELADTYGVSASTALTRIKEAKVNLAEGRRRFGIAETD